MVVGITTIKKCILQLNTCQISDLTMIPIDSLELCSLKMLQVAKLTNCHILIYGF
jgi:hypothetical protein